MMSCLEASALYFVKRHFAGSDFLQQQKDFLEHVPCFIRNCSRRAAFL